MNGNAPPHQHTEFDNQNQLNGHNKSEQGVPIPIPASLNSQDHLGNHSLSPRKNGPSRNQKQSYETPEKLMSGGPRPNDTGAGVQGQDLDDNSVLSVNLDGYGIADGNEVPFNDDEFNIPTLDYEPTLESVLNDFELDLDSISDVDGEDQNHDDQGPLPLLGSKATGHHTYANSLFPIPNPEDTVSIVSVEGSDTRSRSSSLRSSGTTGKSTSRTHGHGTQGQPSKKKPNSILRHVLLKGMTSQINSASERIDAGFSTAIALGTGHNSIVAVGTSHGYALVFDVSQVMKYCLLGDQPKLREAGGAVSSLAVSPNGTRLLVGYAKGLILMFDLENGKLLRTILDGHAAGTAVLILRFTDHPILALCSDSGGSVFELNFRRTMGLRGTDSRCIFSGSRGEVCTFEPLMLSAFPDNPLTRFVLVAFGTLSKIIVVMIRPKLKVLFTHTLQSDPTTLPLLSWQMVIIQTASNSKIVDPVLSFARGNTISFYQATLDSQNLVQLIFLRSVTVGFSILSMHWLNPRTLALIDTREKLRVVDVRTQDELETVDLSCARLVYASSHFKGIATGGNVSRAFALAGERACYNSILCHNNQLLILGTKSVHALTMRLWHERLDYLVRHGHFSNALQLGYELYLEKAKAVVGLKGNKNSKRLIVRDKILYILDRYVQRLPSLEQNFMENLDTAKQNYTDVISTCVNYYVLLDFLDPVFGILYDLASENPISKSAYLESLEPYILNDQLRNLPPTIVKEIVAHYDETAKYKAIEAIIVHLNIESLDIHQTMKLCWTHGLYDAIIYIYTRGMGDYVTPLEELMTELHSAISAEIQLSSSQVVLGNKLLVYISCCLAGRAYPYGTIPAEIVERVQSDVFQLITSLHSRNAVESEVAYPYLRTFLQFDTREFLNVLALSFEEPMFQTELGKRQKQRIVDIMLQIMVEKGNYTPTQVGILFTFLARQVARSDNSLFVSNLLFEQVLEHLTSANECTRIDERQQALLELLHAGGLTHFDHDKLLQKCQKAKFYRVCEMLHERRREYDKILECYLNDESRSHQAFSFLHKIFCMLPDRQEEFQKKFIEHLEELVEIDNKKCAEVIYLHMAILVPDLVRSLEGKPSKQYLLLQGIFNTRDQPQDIATTEKYIALMCTFNPQLVSSFLKTTTTYRISHTLDQCKNSKITEAIVYLYESDGKIQDAFNLLLSQFKEKLDQILGSETNTKTLPWNQLQGHFLVLIQFSQRNSPLLQTSNQKEGLWLPIMELLISSMEKSTSSDLNHGFNEMNKHLLSSMMGHVPLPTILEVVLNNPSYSKATFAEIRDLVTGMLETCTYEEMMVDLVKRITQTDVYDKLKVKEKLIKRGFTSKSKICFLCQGQILKNSSAGSESNSKVVIFYCGHTSHLSCSEKANIKSCPNCGHDAHENNLNSLQELDPTFHESLRQRNPSSSTNAIDMEIDHRLLVIAPDSAHQNPIENYISHSEFELKLDVPFKGNFDSEF